MKRRIPARPWHVAHVTGHMRTGGAERQLLNYLLAADHVEFRHSLVCMSKPGELADVAREAGIPVVQLPVRTRYAVATIRRWADWMRREDVAVIHTHMHHSAMWGRLGAIVGGVPVRVTTEHGMELWKGPVSLGIDRVLTRFTHRHIAVSEDCMATRLRREKVDPSKILLIPNGVPIPQDIGARPHRDRIRSELGIPDAAFVVGTVGRLVEPKGYEYLLEALRILRDSHPGALWLAVGDGDQRDMLTALADRLGIADAVVWAGRRGDVGQVLEAMDVWAMSSIREGLPVALLEAMAAGMPIVGTTVGGIPDAIRDGRDGLLVPPRDPGALSAAVERLMGDAGLAAALAASARARAVERYGIESVARRIEEIYRAELARAFPEAMTR